MPEPVETSDPEGVDYGRVMQLTFVWTIAVGVPIVTIASVFTTTPTWSDRAEFAIRAGAPVWFLTMLVAYGYERRRTVRADAE